MKALEALILGSLIHIPDYQFRVFPHLKDELFQHDDSKLIFKLFSYHLDEYKTIPTRESLDIEIEESTGDAQEITDDAKTLVGKIYSDNFKASVEGQELEWLMDKSKKYLTERACYNTIMQSLDILDATSKSKLTKDAIPDLFKEALSIDFDTDIGHNYLIDAMERYAAYSNVETKIPFSLHMLNRVTGGGAERKALIVPVSGTNVGKSMFLTDHAAFYLYSGYNVLYVTLEMAEFKVAERIDAKLMDTAIGDISKMSNDKFVANMEKIVAKAKSNVIIKEYPPGTFHANHLRALLAELKLKSGFVPDIVMVDYLGLMASYRLKWEEGSYRYMKFVTEELRGVMMEKNMLGFAPMQTNRGGQTDSDPDIDAMSESHGISMTADFMWVMISTPELEKLNLIRFKLWKSRFGSLTDPNSFTVGVDRPKMTMYNADMMSGASVPANPTPIKGLNISVPQKDKTKFKY